MAEDKKPAKNPKDGFRRSNWDYFKMGLTVFVTFACCIFVFFFVYRFGSVRKITAKLVDAATPIIIGLVLAYLLNPIMMFVERHSRKLIDRKIKREKIRKKLPRVLGIVVSMFLLVALIAILIAAFIPSLINSFVNLTETLPGYVESFLRTIGNRSFGDSVIGTTISELVETITEKFENFATEILMPGIQTYITQITTGVIALGKFVINCIVGLIVGVYVMMIKETLVGQCKKVLYAVFRPRISNIVLDILRETDRMFGGFIRGKLVDSLIMGIICYIGCLILRMPNAFLIAVVIGVTNIIPFFGPIIGAIPCIFYVLLLKPIDALYLAIFLLILQQVDGNIIGPKILGSSTGLSSFWVMVAILVGGGMFGFLGMVLGVPAMGVLQYVVRKILAHLLDNRKLPQDTSIYTNAESVDEKTNEIRPKNFDKSE